MKTAELTGRALDYAVALAEKYAFVRVSGKGATQFDGIRIDGPHDTYRCFVLDSDATRAMIKHCEDSPFFENQRYWRPTTGPAGDDIIDRVLIDTLYMGNGIDEHYWRAECIGGYSWAEGTTRREAAMRAYVLSKLGDEVEIPKELQ